MSKNFIKLCYFVFLLSTLVACDSWDAKYPFKIDFIDFNPPQLEGYEDSSANYKYEHSLDRYFGFTMIPDEDITIYGLRVEKRNGGDGGDWNVGRSVYGKEGGKIKFIGKYPYMIKKGTEKIIFHSTVHNDKYDVMKIYTDKGTWIIDTTMNNENIIDKKFKAKKSKDKFDEEKNKDFRERII